MSSNKTSVNVTDIPRFHGRGYQQWVDKMTGIFLITNTKDVIDGTLIPNAANTSPLEPTAPTDPATTSNQWQTYGTRYTIWQSKHAAWKKQDDNYAADNSKAKGIFSLGLDIGIWDQVKEMTAKEIWDWLKTQYGKEAFIKVLEDFRYIRDLKIDLSDPNPQLANFMHHYQQLLGVSGPLLRMADMSPFWVYTFKISGLVTSTSIYDIPKIHKNE